MLFSRRNLVVEDPDNVVIVDHIGKRPYRLTATTDTKTGSLTIRVCPAGNNPKGEEYGIIIPLSEKPEPEKDPYSL